jgi:hypothetical protein
MAAADILSRIATSFSERVENQTPNTPDPLTRDIGGEWRENQPYVSGHFQVWFRLPDVLFKNMNTNTAVTWLHSTCESFTPHSTTLNFADLIGPGQVGASFPTNKTITREFTLAFREYQNLPILRILKMWCAVYDSFLGVSPLKGSEFIPKNYKGICVVVNTKPVGAGTEKLNAEDVEEVYVYRGVMPKSVPTDALNADQTANDFIQYSVPFSFDGAPLTTIDGSATIEYCLKHINTLGKFSSTYDNFIQGIG